MLSAGCCFFCRAGGVAASENRSRTDLIAFCVATMEMHHFPDVVLLVPHPSLLRLTGMGAIVPATDGH